MRSPVRVARARLDVGASDVLAGLAACARRPDAERAAAALERLWSPAGGAVACLSARSGFDLLLAAVDWPPGSEVLFSAITIPHLATLVRAHGHVPVAVDVDPDTLALDPGAVRAACTPRTRALVHAQLFGARADLGALAAVAREAGLLLVDDRAQCYDGTARDLGPEADVALYSFGTIKTATCLGGGLALVADPALAGRMRARQRTWPVQTTRSHVCKLARGALMVAVGHPAAYPTFVRVADRLAGGHDALVRSLSRSCPDAGLLVSVRRRPSGALLAVMRRRLGAYDPARVRARRRAGAVLAAALGPQVVTLGGRAPRHTYWLFPVVARDPDALVAAGRAAGFDLTRGSSTLVALDPRCARAAAAMEHVVYLPAYARMSDADLRRLAAVVNAAESPTS